jgi:hypothetical protein
MVKSKKSIHYAYAKAALALMVFVMPQQLPWPGLTVPTF